MKRYNSTLNEEINRMKSLFTEERMFGNLITEDVNGDPIESFSDLLTSNDFNTKDAKATEPIYSREFKPYNIVKVKERLSGKGKKTSSDFDFNRASLRYSIKFTIDNQKVVSNWVGYLEFPYTDGDDKEQIELIGNLIDSKNSGGNGVDLFKTKFTESLKSDWFKSKAGTNPEFSTKQDAGDVKQQRKDNVSATKKEINRSKDECRDFVKDMYKQVRQGKTKEEFQKEDIQGVQFCMNSFYTTFEKEGLFRKGDEIRIMYKTLGIKPTEKMIELGAGKDDEEITGDTFDDAKAEAGVEGERYVVKDQNGTKVAIVRKVGANKFNFRSKMNVSLVDKTDKGNIKFTKEYISNIYKELNINPNKQRIVIQKATETDKMDVGTFVLTNV
jgi:ribosome-binding protein aMBF1 (putative translation factor)